MWVFGYGSLVWKTGFPFEESLPGFVRESRMTTLKDFRVDFGSRVRTIEGHRRSPDELSHSSQILSDWTVVEGEVWGVAYRIALEKVEEVTAYLDHREKAGYESCEVEFHPDDESRASFPLQVYISPPSSDNPHWVGDHETPDQIAEQVVNCVGPSGTNIEYLVRLAEAQRQLNPGLPDDHLFTIEKLVIDKCRQRALQDPTLLQLGLL